MALQTAEQAAIWATVGGLTARILIRHPLRRLLGVLLIHAIRDAQGQAQIADRLDTQTDGGLHDVIDAIREPK